MSEMGDLAYELEQKWSVFMARLRAAIDTGGRPLPTKVRRAPILHSEHREQTPPPPRFADMPPDTRLHERRNFGST
jgi:hypothetical protein